MIYYNSNTINDWNFGDDNIIKVYKHGAVCYYKITSGDTPTPVQEPCYAVVDDITQYSDREFEDVYDKATEKWYKLNNLNEYEEYGVYASGRTSCEGSTSRLPQGYTEVEYIENTGTTSSNGAYLNLGLLLYDAIGNSFVISSRLKSEFYSASGYDDLETIINSESVSSPYYGFVYRYEHSTHNVVLSTNPSNHATLSTTANTDGTTSLTISCNSTTVTGQVPLGLFASYNANYNTPYRFAKATIYSFTVVKNGTTVRDLVPCKRDSDDKYGMYDIVNDVFYVSPNNIDFSGGEPITPTDCVTTYEGKLTIDDGYEYIYSGGSWVNVGEVSGSTIIIKSPEYIEKDSSHNGKINLDYVWKTNSKMQFKFYSTSNGGGSMIGEDGIMPDNNDCRMFFASTTAYFDWGSSRISWSSNGRRNTLYEYEYGNYYIKNMVTSASKTSSTISTSRTNTLYLGLGGADMFRTYYLKFYDGNTLVKDFIPWTDMNGNYGLFDKVSLSVYNVVSGSLTGSSNVTDVEVGGGYEYPLEYPVKQDPPNNLTFTSMTEAESYECPWVGMQATIDGVKYIFSGDSQSGYEWVYNPSRLPVGYTEVEYITSEYVPTGASGAYIDTNFLPNQTTRVVMDYQPTVNGQTNRRIFGSGEYNTLGYVWNMEGTLGKTSCYYYYKFGTGSSWYTTSINPDLNRHTVDFNNNGQILLDDVSVATLPSGAFTCTFNLGIFRSIFNQYQQNNICFLGRVYSVKVYDNGTLVRDMIPCTRDSDSIAGMYDIINNTFYSSANSSYQFVAGNPV